jgi:nucleoside-diphosphate-sugar epimerase
LVKDAAEAFYLALTKPNADGKSYNLVGDVRLTAREYVAELSRILERPISFIGVPPRKAKAEAVSRWALKSASGRPGPFPNFHEISCWGLYGRFDNQEIKQDLGWRPVADRETFIREGIEVHRKADRKPGR